MVAFGVGIGVGVGVGEVISWIVFVVGICIGIGVGLDLGLGLGHRRRFCWVVVILSCLVVVFSLGPCHLSLSHAPSHFSLFLFCLRLVFWSFLGLLFCPESYLLYLFLAPSVYSLYLTLTLTLDTNLPLH